MSSHDQQRHQELEATHDHTTSAQLSREQLLAELAYVERIERNGVLFHGGYDATGACLPPRSLHSAPAISAWTAQLEADGHPSTAIDTGAVTRAFVPKADQARMPLRNGATDAMTRT